MPGLKRTRLGKHFSEGARQLWLLMRKRRWRQKELAEALNKSDSVANRWLYGDRAPDRESSLLLQQVLGIDPALWGKKPRKAFVLPLLKEAA